MLLRRWPVGLRYRDRWCWPRAFFLIPDQACRMLHAGTGRFRHVREVAMRAFLERLLDSSMLSPHGICLLWESELIWLHVASDAVIAVAYFSIPFALALLLGTRRDIESTWIYWAFAIFIMACGFTHVFAIYTLWVPVYGIEGLVKAL